MKDQIITIQQGIASLAEDITSAVLNEFPNGMKNVEGRNEDIKNCKELEAISRQLQILTTRAGKLIEKLNDQ